MMEYEQSKEPTTCNHVATSLILLQNYFIGVAMSGIVGRYYFIQTFSYQSYVNHESTELFSY